MLRDSYHVGLFTWIDSNFQCKILRFMTDFNPTRPPHKYYPTGRWNLLADVKAGDLANAEQKLWNDIQDNCDIDITLPCIVRLVCETSNRDPKYLHFTTEKLFFTTEIPTDPTWIVLTESKPSENIADAKEKMFEKLTQH